jgi:hypothetical protein
LRAEVEGSGGHGAAHARTVEPARPRSPIGGPTRPSGKAGSNPVARCTTRR